MNESEWLRTRVWEAEQELVAVIKTLMDDLPQGYIMTGCDVGIGRVDLVGGGSRVFIDGAHITVELAPTSPPSTTAP